MGGATKDKVDATVFIDTSIVLLIDNETGLTKYYEYGRYDTGDGSSGRVRSSDVDEKLGIPNVVIDPETGKPTQKSLNKVLSHLSKISGQKGRIEGAYVEGNFKVMNDYAQEKMKESNDDFKEYDKNRRPYSISNNNCGTFGMDVLDQDPAVHEKRPWILDPRPSSIIDEYQDDFPKIRYDPQSNTTTSDKLFKAGE